MLDGSQFDIEPTVEKWESGIDWDDKDDFGRFSLSFEDEI